MTTRVNESGNIELCSGKYGPRVKLGVTLSPEDLDDLYEEARRHAKTKSTEDIENVREIIADAFPSRVHRDWFRSEKLAHLGLSLEAKDDLDNTAPPTFPFLNALRRKFCGHDWAQVHAGRRDELRMSVGGVGCFDEYLSQVEGCNNRLKGVGNYFTPAQLLTILARGITPTLTAILSEQGVVINESITYKDWVTSCRDLEVRFKSRLMSADRNGRRGNFGTFGQSNGSSNNNVPLHKRTATSEPAAHPNKRTSTDGSTTSGPFYMRAFSKMPEAMQKEQRELLGRINACVKCRTAWGTCASNLDKCTGATLTVPWRPLTKEMVDWAIAAHKSTGRPILYNAILKQANSTVPVASIHATPLDDISQYVEAGNNRPPPVAAAIYGSRVLSHVARDGDLFGSFAGPSFKRSGSRGSLAARAVAPVVGQRRLTRDDDDEDLDWSEGSISPSPKTRRNSIDGSRSDGASNVGTESGIEDSQARLKSSKLLTIVNLHWRIPQPVGLPVLSARLLSLRYVILWSLVFLSSHIIFLLPITQPEL
ncbi:hypothetical protein C8J55DRAFT_493471 [Lentinula edodes]|uniref:Uncharacterized protein n=1 Tax=Lentinula lateritia TaxID=40482 RepID=A0A9W9DEF4_9AGAR|nr:hypothetical protein C8J55DRAFT_493471 [Lentinula edodes]